MSDIQWINSLSDRISILSHLAKEDTKFIDALIKLLDSDTSRNDITEVAKQYLDRRLKFVKENLST